MLILQSMGYVHPNKHVLFTDINLVIHPHDKIALIGNNGAGKSTLLTILAGNVKPSAGTVKTKDKPYYVPQLFGQFNAYTVAQALGVDEKLQALEKILAGNVTDEYLTLLNDDWAIEERCREALAHWSLEDVKLTDKMETFSGGQKTKIFLAGIAIHQPEMVLLDEPSNHLDAHGRKLLYDYILSTSQTLVVVSHDRTLLNLMKRVFELGKRGITVYGGNYDFYAEQKMIENDAFHHDVKSMEKALRKAKETERESMERQQKLDARGKKKQEKAGLPTISMNTFKNNAEKSTSRTKGVHEEKVTAIATELKVLRNELPDVDKMKMDFDNSNLRKGKLLLQARNVNFGYDGKFLWKQDLNFEIRSAERIALTGSNGSGKTTLLKLILGELEPQSGVIDRIDVKAIYIDQEYSLIDNSCKVYEQAQQFNSGALKEHDVKTRLNRFLFTKDDWDKPCVALSGGEKMRLILCCLTISRQAPDMIVLDEPTNNLDIQNSEILTAAINDYKGTLVVVSHDDFFLRQIGIDRSVSVGL